MDNMIKSIISENLYQSVYALQGPRNILVDQKQHNEAGNKIIEMFNEAGLNVVIQEFQLPGCDYIFRNIEGQIGDVDNEESVVLLAHYDTVETTFGANDNAAGVAVLVEIGRMLAKSNKAKACSIVAVDLEETRSNPTIFGRELAILQSLGIRDESFRYTSYKNKSMIEYLNRTAMKNFDQGEDQGEGYRKALSAISEDLPENVVAGLEEISHLYDGLTVATAIGKRSRIGSHQWLQKALKDNRKIKYAIAIDEPGIYYSESLTQRPVKDFDFDDFTGHYLLDSDNRVGNFVSVLSANSSKKYAKELLSSCEASEIEMPYAWMHLPLDFHGICSHAGKALGSDHAAFWQEGIPAIFVFDSSMGRDPYVHTYGDTIDKINFDSLSRLTIAIVKTIERLE